MDLQGRSRNQITLTQYSMFANDTMKHHLITTGGVELPTSNDPILLLGPWCDDHSLAEQSSQQVTSSHSQNSLAELHQLRVLADEISNRIFPDLCAELNRLHQTDHSLRFWEYSVQLWLINFVDTIIDRWQRIDSVASSYSITGTTIHQCREMDLIPQTSNQFQFLINSHLWNHLIFGKIIQELGQFPYSIAPQPSTLKVEFVNDPSSNNLRTITRQLLQKISNSTTKASSVFFVQTYLPKLSELKLGLMLGTLPYRWYPDKTISNKPDSALRASIDMKIEVGDHLERFIRKTIPLQIPMSFLENFKDNQQLIKDRPLPKNPRVIFTSNLHQSSDQFMLWLGQKATKGSSVVIGQHGGVHGMIEPASREELHERQISDRYLTWGWGDDENTVFAPGPALINTGINSGTKTKQRLATQLLIVLDSTYRYPSMRRGMNGSRMSYLQSVGALIKNLDPITQNVALVRPYRGQEQFDDSHLPYFEQNFPEIKIDSGSTPIKNLWNSSKLVVTTSIGTTYIQTIHRKIPTLIVLDPKSSNLSARALPSFQNLERIGVYHSSFSSAAKFINSIWTDIDQWWLDPSVQAALDEFMNQFGRVSSHPLRIIKSNVKSTILSSHEQHDRRD